MGNKNQEDNLTGELQQHSQTIKNIINTHGFKK